MPLSALGTQRLHAGLAALVAAFLDQVSKGAAQAFLQGGPPRPIVKGFFHLTYTQNTGAAFGLFRDCGPLLSIVSLAFLLAVIVFGTTIPLSSRSTRLALGAGIGGAVSNILDRFTKGYVIDFIDFRVWPVFNLADVAIVLGIGLVCLRFAFQRPPPTVETQRDLAAERTDNNVS